MTPRPAENAPAPAAAGTGGGDRLFSRTLAGFKWAFLTSAAQALLSLAILMALSRLLAPGDFGVLAVALVFLSLAETAGRRGLGPALVQRFELTLRHVSTAFSLSLAAGVLLAAALWVLAPWLAWLAGASDATPVIRTLSLATAIVGAGVVSEHRLRRELRFRELMVAAVLAQCVGNGLVAVALAWLGFGVWALVWGTLARHAVFALAVIAFAPPPPPDAGRREAADLLGAGAGFSALALFGALSGQALILTIAGTLGAAAVGLYTRARALSVVTARLGPVLRNVLLPAMARRQRRIERLRTVHLNGVELLALAALPTSGLIALAAPEIVAVVLGDQWTGAVPALRILALGGALHAVNAVHVPLIRALGAVYREAGRRALYMALLLGGAWFASRWGLLGVAAAVAAAQAVLHVELTHLALSLLGLRPAALLRRYAPALWVTLWACAALSFAAAAVRAAAWPALAALAAKLAAWGGAAAAAAYFAPPFARPAFPHWCLERLDFQPMGAAGRWTRAALERLARRWPAPREAGPS